MPLFKKNTRLPKILLIQGSLSPQSKTAILVGVASNALRNRALPYDILDLSTANLDFYNEAQTYGKSTHVAIEKIKASDGLLFFVPVYGGAVSGGVKNLIDIAGDACIGKHAGLACYSAESNSYPASVQWRAYLSSQTSMSVVQPILHTNADSFKQNSVYDDAAIDILEEMIDSLFVRLQKGFLS